MSGSVERVRQIRASSNGQAVEQSIETGFRITIESQRQHNESLLFLNGKPLINRGELVVLVALPGSGKTQTCAAIASSYVSKATGGSCCTLGFTFSESCNKNILYIDTERPFDDNVLTFQSIARRLGNPKIIDDRIAGLDYYGLVDIANYEALREKIEKLLEQRKYDALIIDGALDLSPALNDEVGAKEAVIWLRSLAARKDIGVITTLHPNKGTETAAGHIGSFLYRYCRAMLLIRNTVEDRAVKELTAEFAQGKLSHCDPAEFEPHYFAWDDTQKMMMSTDKPDGSSCKYMASDFEYIFLQFRKNQIMHVPAKQLKDAYANRINRGVHLAKKHIQDAVQDEVIGVFGKGKNTRYYMSTPF